jgi:hypothetical protein
MQKTIGKHLTHTLTASLLLFVVGILFIGTILSSKKDVSENEKRRLAVFPEIVWKRSPLNRLPKAIEQYLGDHLFFREELVRLNALLRKSLFYKSPNSLVLIGDKNWYYYLGDGALLDYLGKSGKTDNEAVSAWENTLARREKMLHEKGGYYLFAVAPNKESVYPEFLPVRISDHAGTTMLEALSRHIGHTDMAGHFLDLGESLRRAKKDGHIYFQTDTHWSRVGAYFAYLEIMRRLAPVFPDIVPLSRDRLDRQNKQDCTGDLSNFMGLSGSITEECEIINIKDPCARTINKKLKQDLPESAELEFSSCPKGAPLRVLVISDSFGSTMQDYLAETFQEVAFSREQTLSELPAFLAKYRPDLVLQLHVGRFMDKALDAEK